MLAAAQKVCDALPIAGNLFFALAICYHLFVDKNKASNPMNVCRVTP